MSMRSVTRLEEAEGLTNNQKSALQQKEQQLQEVELEINSLRPKLEKLEKQRAALIQDIGRLKGTDTGQSQTMRSVDALKKNDAVHPRDKLITDMQDMWKMPATGEHEDQTDRDESPRDKMLADMNDMWRK